MYNMTLFYSRVLASIVRPKAELKSDGLCSVTGVDDPPSSSLPLRRTAGCCSRSTYLSNHLSRPHDDDDDARTQSVDSVEAMIAVIARPRPLTPLTTIVAA